MINEKDLPWMKIHEFLLEIGSIRTPKNFCLSIAENICKLIPYDQARVYFINDNGKVQDIALFGTERSWIEAYFEYYSRVEGGRYSFASTNIQWSSHKNSPVNCIDWSDFSNDEFITDYIRPQGIRHSLIVVFHDESGISKTICTFERTSNNGYTPKEMLVTEVLQSHLDNLHKNLHVLLSRDLSNLGTFKEIQRLTHREMEIVQLICNGVKPTNISEKLCLTPGTVYKHLANIYAKLHVTNLQELILMVMSDKIKNGK